MWEFVLHVAYWEYAVRRVLENAPAGSFPRSPSDWPAVPAPPEEKAWKRDRELLRTEHDALVEAVRLFDPSKLDAPASEGGAHRHVDLIYGAIMHNTYHVGQIQVTKRLFAERRHDA